LFLLGLLIGFGLILGGAVSGDFSPEHGTGTAMCLFGVVVVFLTIVLGGRLLIYALLIQFAARNWYTGRDQHHGERK
jgi:hypothetical protein